MAIRIREMKLQDYEQALALWESSAGVGLSSTDSRHRIAAYLERNPGLSFVATDGKGVVGAVLCGHDGRRGFVHHLAVRADKRRNGIGRVLVDRCIAALERHGIDKSHLLVFRENRAAIAFWEALGWERRGDITVMSRYTQAAK